MTTKFKNTNATRKEFYDPQSGNQIAQGGRGPFVCLLTLKHKSFANIYLVNNTENITSRGQVFTAAAIRIVLPPDDGKREPICTIDIDNVTRDLIDEFRSITDPITVIMEMIFTEYPDDVEYALKDLSIVGITYDRQVISAKLMYNDFLNQAFPSWTYNPTEFAGIF